MRAAYSQWLVTKYVGNLDPNGLASSAGVNDKAHSLIAE
jgi:hypothetical protein